MNKTIAIAIHCMISTACLADPTSTKGIVKPGPEPAVNCKEWSYNPSGSGVWIGTRATFTLGKCTNKFAATSIAKHTVKVCGGYDLTNVLDAKCGPKAKH
jgi:hypothetical protein